MSNRKDNINNKKLKEFLDTGKNSADEAMDDFEKEAQEGFALLENEQEIFDLKARVDKRVYSEVFTEEKKSHKGYWYAAAGLMLVVGFTVYFIQNNPVAKKETLAVQAQQQDAKDEIQKSMEAQPETSEDLKPKETKVLNGNSMTAGLQEKQGPAFKSIPGKVDETVAPKGLAYNTEMNSSGVAASAVAEPHVEPAPAVTTDSKKQMNQAPVALADEDFEKDRAATKDDLAKSPAPESKADKAIILNEEERAQTSERKKKSVRKEQKVAVGAASQSELYFTSITCYYTGGEEALVKDLRTIFGTKNLLQKFDATLYINEKRKVEKAVLTNAYELNTSDQQKVMDILKQLDKFNFTGTTPPSSLVEYKVVFRP